MTTLYEKGAGEKGWFGPTLTQIADEDQLGQILAYNENQARVLVGKSKDAKPTYYYYVFETAYQNGVIPNSLSGVIQKDRALAELVVIAPEQMEERMAFVNALEMSRSLDESGRVALYGIYFDTNKNTLRPDSLPTLQEIVKLLSANPRNMVWPPVA